MLAIVVDLYRECICSALLPPCPRLRATTTASRWPRSPCAAPTCRVLDVCNWSSRRFAVTMPMLGYWLGWMPFDRLAAAGRQPAVLPARDGRVVRVDATNAAASPDVRGGTGGEPARSRPRAAKGRWRRRPTAAGATKATAGADDTAVPAALRVAAQYATSTITAVRPRSDRARGLGATDPDGAALASDAELDGAVRGAGPGPVRRPGGRAASPDAPAWNRLGVGCWSTRIGRRRAGAGRRRTGSTTLEATVAAAAEDGAHRRPGRSPPCATAGASK